MKTYTEFHGKIPIKDIGKRLRDIVRTTKTSFKILTGYGSTGTASKSKFAAITSLNKMKKEGLIKAFLPGEVLTKLLTSNDPYYEDKQRYQSIIKNDPDYGNDGIIFTSVCDGKKHKCKLDEYHEYHDKPFAQQLFEPFFIIFHF